MAGSHQQRVAAPGVAMILKWTARISSVFSLALLAMFLFGEPGAPTPGEWVALAFFPGGVALGMIAGWSRELIGGAVAVGSLAAFYVVMFALRGQAPAGPYFALFAAPGFLFLAAGALRPCGPSRCAA